MANIEKQKEMAAELSTKLWNMANELRGNMDASEFKNYILGLIFYRYLSQKVEKHFNKELEEDNLKYKEAFEMEEYHDEIINASLETLGYVIQPKYLFSSLIEMIEKDKFSIDYLEEVINSIIESTEGQTSEDAFIDLFEDMDLKSTKLGKEIKQRTKLISTILNTIDEIEIDFDDAEFDILGTAYMTLIGNFASSAGKKGGEFYTPANMSKLVARLATVGLKNALSVFDCACGSGSLLLEVGNYCNVRNYYGQEWNSSTYNLARMNMLLHNIKYENFKIVNCDTLTDNTHFEDMKFTLQVANPPYSLKWDSPNYLLDDERFSAYGKLAPKSAADLAFVQTMINHMDEDGRIAVLLPHGALVRSGVEETIRNYILKDLNYIDAIIGLPVNCFQGTGTPVCCVVLKQNRNGNKDNIMFIDASQYFTAGNNINYITDEDIDRIVNAYIDRKNIENFAYVASIEEIKNNDYSLNLIDYVDNFKHKPKEEETKLSVETFEDIYKTIFNKLKLVDFENHSYDKLFQNCSNDLEEVRFGDLIEEITIKTTKENEYELLSSAIEGVFLNSELFSHQRGSGNTGYKVVEKNQLILSTQNLHLGNANVNTRFDIGIVSPAYKIYKLKNCDPMFMSYYIKTDKMKKIFYQSTTPGASACRRNVKWEALYNSRLLLPNITMQKKIGEFLFEINQIIEMQNKLLKQVSYDLVEKGE